MKLSHMVHPNVAGFRGVGDVTADDQAAYDIATQTGASDSDGGSMGMFLIVIAIAYLLLQE